MANPTHVIDYEALEVVEDLSYEEKPLGILACKVKDIAFVKVWWRNQPMEEATWEREVVVGASSIRVLRCCGFGRRAPDRVGYPRTQLLLLALRSYEDTSCSCFRPKQDLHSFWLNIDARL